MKLADLKVDFVMEYCNAYEEDRALIDAFISSSVAYVLAYTNKDLQYLNDKEDITVAVLTLVNEMYVNREATVKENKVNAILESILGFYNFNLL